MKLIKLLLFAIISLFAFNCFAQDATIRIGGGTLRYDSDSAKFIFSKPLFREQGGRLFDFNQNQFFWSPTTGLNSLPNPFPDTTLSQHAILYKDSIKNEIIFHRSYTFSKPHFYHNPDIYDLEAHYQSVRNGVELFSKDISVFNSSFDIYSSDESIPITDPYLLTLSPPLDHGTFLYIINYEITFEKATISKTDDNSEQYTLVVSQPSFPLAASQSHTYYRFFDAPSGEVFPSSLSYISKAEDQITLIFTASAQSGIHASLTKLSVRAIRVN